MDKTYYTVYRVTNEISGKFYIGTHKTKNLDDNYMGSGKYLKYAQQKYGIENFKKEILFIFDTPVEMYAKEAELVTEEFLATENTYNLKVGGFGGWDYSNKVLSSEERTRISNCSSRFTGHRHSEDLKKRYSETRKGSQSWWLFGKPGTFTGKTHTEETKNKMREIAVGKHDGEKNSQFGTIWITNGSEAKKINKTDSIPEGWRRGRK